MDKLITLSCPSCGASLEVAFGAEQVSCKYCGNTHALLDILPTESFQSDIKSDAARARLMKFFDFNMKDLEYNRQGKLSPYQEERFSSQGFTAFGLFFAAGLGSIIFIIVWSPFHEPFLCSSMAVIISMILGLISYKLIMRPVKSGVVQTEVGSLGKPKHMSIWKPVIYIGRKAFPVRDDPFKALAWDVPYKVYYTPIGNVVLSIELLKV
jgi:hypothetical protein